MSGSVVGPGRQHQASQTKFLPSQSLNASTGESRGVLIIKHTGLNKECIRWGGVLCRGSKCGMGWRVGLVLIGDPHRHPSSAPVYTWSPSLPCSAPGHTSVTLLQFVKTPTEYLPSIRPFTKFSGDLVDSQECHPLLCRLAWDTHS